MGNMSIIHIKPYDEILYLVQERYELFHIKVISMGTE